MQSWGSDRGSIPIGLSFGARYDVALSRGFLYLTANVCICRELRLRVGGQPFWDQFRRDTVSLARVTPLLLNELNVHVRVKLDQ